MSKRTLTLMEKSMEQ